jgi:hypothetical protein
MDSAESRTQNPEAEYQRRLEELRAAEARYKNQDTRIAYARFALMICIAALAIWLIFSKVHSLYWVFVPVALFVICAIIHEHVLRALQRTQRAVAFYERGLTRLRNQWMGSGQSGERFLDPSHPYARDLDLFGGGSLFELLCTARTRAGERTLADWLLAPAPPEEALSRQSAVADMRSRLQFREDLAVLSANIDAGVHPDALVKWAVSSPSFESHRLRVVLQSLGYAWWLSLLVCVIRWQLWPFAAVITIVNLAVVSWFSKRAEASIASIEAAAYDLGLLSGVIARTEREQFSSAKLITLQKQMKQGSEPASRAIRRLSRLVDKLADRHNMVVMLFDRPTFRSLICALRIEAWRKQYGSEVRVWLGALGEMEALSDLAGYSYEHPADVFPEFTAESPCFEAEGLAHPLMPEATAIRNDLSLGRKLRLIIISGPNMAGKSTFVRAVGVNAVLAQCGAPVRATKLRISPLAVAASVCVLDSLQGGISRFYAEIIRLKLIVDMTKETVPVLFLLDELLSGTNSHDRRLGSEALVRGLFERNAVGLVTTHDLSLTEIVNIVGERAANVHFEDRVEDGQLRFDYHLTPGIVQTSNALNLMRSIGLDV